MAVLRWPALAIMALVLASLPVPGSSLGACREDLPPPSDSYLNPSGCIRCSADNSTCLECGSHHARAANGTCIRCRPPGDFGKLCASCEADAPDVCTGCASIQYGMDFTENYGVYLAENGTCVPCKWATPNCYACLDGNATCTECDLGFALVSGQCTHCTDAKCLQCKESPDRCTECQAGDVTGLYLDAKTHSCVPCTDPACVACSNSSSCEMCSEGYTPKGSACIPCAKPQCIYCQDGPDTCTGCTMGGEWVLDPVSQNCVPCGVANCTQCGAPGKCDWCQGGFRVAQNGTKCEQCQVARCENCVEDASKCMEFGCIASFRLNNATGQCEQCTVPHCLGCLPALDLCSGCEVGYKLGEPVAGTQPPSSKECVPDPSGGLEPAGMGLT
ncbi:High cysteine membrane Group 5 [Chlorella sorokiniana]|uniref:High cysteine membrane Group 5 n=1 Tax=Chlorella sorokiniana TaxID=3076 RepID=A0A2P6TFZ8_CHLSO|nr:High cysteine membrane Group 5 [Chlorella sorokiniana]|eukprot:PRW33025.1 High cysteine membrane Group 5 [Chlorella sorokiniana]